MKHQISVHGDGPGRSTPGSIAQIKRCITAALEVEHVCVPCEVNVLLTDDVGIRAYNRQFRDLDQATDVLSFPEFTLTPGAFPADGSAYLDPDGLFPLGDMAISVERARAQAAQYGHSEARELGYLTIHSVLHLLGYDHMDEGAEKQAMRRQEDLILERLGLGR